MSLVSVKGNVYFQCRGEDYWDKTSIGEEMKITSSNEEDRGLCEE